MGFRKRYVCRIPRRVSTRQAVEMLLKHEGLQISGQQRCDWGDTYWKYFIESDEEGK